MTKSQIRLPLEYWQVVEQYGDIHTVCNNVVNYCIKNDLYLPAVSHEVSAYKQTCKTITFNLPELEELYRMYDTRTISPRKMLIYCIENGIEEAFMEPTLSANVDTVLPTQPWVEPYCELCKSMYNLTRIAIVTGMPNTISLLQQLNNSIKELGKLYEQEYTNKHQADNNS